MLDCDWSKGFEEIKIYNNIKSCDDFRPEKFILFYGRSLQCKHNDHVTQHAASLHTVVDDFPANPPPEK